ncbi:hypothetical protein D3C78_1720120 [compost metagenome]
MLALLLHLHGLHAEVSGNERWPGRPHGQYHHGRSLGDFHAGTAGIWDVRRQDRCASEHDHLRGAVDLPGHPFADGHQGRA